MKVKYFENQNNVEEENWGRSLEMNSLNKEWNVTAHIKADLNTEIPTI